MLFYGLQYAILQSCIVRYCVYFKFTMHIDRNHYCYSFDGSSLQSPLSLGAVVPLVQDMLM